MMHASNAFLNGATGTQPHGRNLLRALLAAADPDPAEQAKKRDQRKAEEERKAPTANRQGAEFDNDPDDSANPNEVRERHNRTVKPS
jgi:hypothetical protein